MGLTGYGNTPLVLPLKWGNKMSVASDFVDASLGYWSLRED